MTQAWPKIKLQELLRRSVETVNPVPDKEYREITVRMWGKGVIERGRVRGSDLSGRRFTARGGQFIASRIDARHGAMGLVPQSLDGALVTTDFPLFDLNTERIEPAFFAGLCRTAGFIDLCKRASEGTTNRVRMKEERFFALDIPLPPLTEQRRIVARIEEVTAQINEAHTLCRQAAEETEAFVISNHIQLSGGRTRRLDEFLRLDEDAVPVQADGSYPQVGVRSFGEGLFAKSAISGTETTYRSFNRLFEGALVLSQVKGWEGAVAVCPKKLSGWLVSPEYRTFRCIEGEARPGYLSSIIPTEWFWGRLTVATRGAGDRRERTRPEQFLNIEVPMPDWHGQEFGERVFQEVDVLKRLQTETAAELDAMLPAILDRAFKGEL
jgi:type I restriction enzyme, S subunit